MKNLKIRAFCLIIASFIVLLLPVNSSAAKRKKVDYVGKTFYLQTNMWNESGKDILSTNFHRGGIIPVGTEVTIKSMGRTAIKFTTKETGKQFKFVLAKKHSKLNIFELADRYFGADHPLTGKYTNFSAEEKDSIKKGIITTGMSKDAVVMAYGYPPTHRTPGLDLDTWNYWENRIRRFEVMFSKGKVVNINGMTFN
ncbi:MAG: hypothetical protein K8S27_15210 [Candidatus Omnitrophica bacterium]|nr:hypothetical protein [Candidatus Omnitrophota bacterium]